MKPLDCFMRDDIPHTGAVRYDADTPTIMTLNGRGEIEELTSHSEVPLFPFEAEYLEDKAQELLLAAARRHPPVPQEELAHVFSQRDLLFAGIVLFDDGTVICVTEPEFLGVRPVQGANSNLVLWNLPVVVMVALHVRTTRDRSAAP